MTAPRSPAASTERRQLLAVAGPELDDRDRIRVERGAKILRRVAAEQPRSARVIAVPRQLADRVEERRARARRRDSATAAAAAAARGSAARPRRTAIGCAAWTRRHGARLVDRLSAPRRSGTSRRRTGSAARNQLRKVGRSSSRAVAGDAPFITKCSPSKKSAEYSGYDAIGAEAGERRESVLVHSQPLPTRSSTPQALSPGRMAARRLGIPAREVEHAVRWRRRRVLPHGMATLVPVRRAERGALELGFGRQPRAAPARERRGLRLAHVDRPRSGSGMQVEHPAPVPRRRRRAPRTADARAPRACEPVPVLGAPPARIAGSRRPRRTPGTRVGDVVPLDRERRHVDYRWPGARCPRQTAIAPRSTPSVRGARGHLDPLLVAARRPLTRG